ncbi:hypothetical protein RZN05_09685 [Sphingomonas sp. HF-S4]|uniref:Uncharacterized protein n=1 Tax=Sphingomonas agrestis TaxID=3080540 RepID=A0ABU3Y7V1_9SPHN|nr:hypothetical protein [Sphingomonas sp. HF-S4]MDV3457253.1 hypothetical protein [Sphingomonas sp. HF-S4]
MRERRIDTLQEQQIYNCQATNVNPARFCIVNRPSSSSAPEAQTCAYRVGRPHASDAVALSLRDAFEREAALPEDMAALLQQLNHEMSTGY